VNYGEWPLRVMVTKNGWLLYATPFRSQPPLILAAGEWN